MLEHKHVIVRAEVENAPTCPEFVKEWLADIIKSIDMNLAPVTVAAKPTGVVNNIRAVLATFLPAHLAEIVKPKTVMIPANPVAYYCTLDGNEGTTGSAILETSHCAVHVWHLDGIMQFDLYTCSALPLDIIFSKFEQFNPTKIEHAFFDRDNKLTLVEMK